MADDKITPADAAQLLQAVKVLEALERDGKLNRTEQVALERWRAKNGGPSAVDRAQEEDIKTRSQYRGLASGATLNAKDEMYGAYKAATGGSYAEGRDGVRQRDEAARMLAPNEYAKGEIAGLGMTAALPISGASALASARNLSGAARVGIGAAEGGLLASLPTFMGGEGGFQKRAAGVDPFWTGMGMVLGGAAPAAGEIGAALTRTGERMSQSIPGFSSKASNVVSRSFAKAQSGGTDIEEYLRSIGPQGMIADIPGAPQSTAQGLAAMGGSGANVLGRELTGRAAGAEARIDGAVDRSIGGPNLAFEQQKARAAQRSSVLGPLYDAAKQSPDPIDVRAITSGLVMMRQSAIGPVRAKIDDLLADLSSETGMISAEKLHNIRVELGATIRQASMTGRGDVVANMSPVLEGVDRRLDTIENYATARGGWADSKALDDAADDGRSVLTGGPTTVETPQRFAERFAKMPDATKEALRSGVREYIASLMGTSRNAPAAAWSKLADQGFNDKKLRIILGDQEADFVLSTLRGEKAFSETRGAVLSGSQTEFRKQAAEDLGDIREPGSINRPGPVGRAKKALFDDPINTAIDSVIYGTRRSSTNAEVGMLLSLQGADRDRAVRALLELSRREGVDTKKQLLARTLADTIAGTAGAVYTNSQQGPQ